MNYSRFYALFRLLPKYGDDEALKMQLVLEASHGRTTSLRELSKTEYDNLCHELDMQVGRREILRKERSATLRLMQQAGVNTTDWAAVDNFCLNKRIAGQVFRHLDIEELGMLRKKIRAIINKQKNVQEKTNDSH